MLELGVNLTSIDKALLSQLKGEVREKTKNLICCTECCKAI